MCIINYRKLQENIIMINLVTSSPIYKQNQNPSSLSFKGIQEQEPLSIDDFIVYQKANIESKKILASKQDLVRTSKVEYRHAQGVINSRLRRLEDVLECSPEKIKERNGKKYYTESFNGRLHSTTTFVNGSEGIKIDRVDVFNADGSKDIFIADEKNGVRNIHKNFRQIAPKSFIEDAGYKFENGVLTASNGVLSFVNDGNAIVGIDERKDVYRFKEGELTSFSPHISCAGKDFFASKIYRFQDNRLVGYTENYTKLEDGFVDATKSYDYSKLGFIA